MSADIAGKSAALPFGKLIIGAALVGLFVLAGALSLVWTPYDPAMIDIADRLLAPQPAHPLGTDHLGRDVLSLLMAGARSSIIVAFLAVSIGVIVGSTLGLAAAAYGGAGAEAILRVNDILFAFPALILAVLISAAYGPGAYAAIIAVGVFNIPVFARLVRGAALPLWQSGFTLAARAAGKSRTRISIEHIAPNIVDIVAVQTTIQFSLAILAEAGLSFVGLGVQPPAPSWGRMLAESQTLILTAPWLAIFPGLAIFLFVLGLNLTSEALRARLGRPQRVLAS